MCQAAWYLHLIKTWDNQSAAVREGTEFSEAFESCKMLVPCKMSPLQSRTAFEVATRKVCSLSNLQSSSSWNSAHFNGTAMLRPWGTNRGHESPLLSTLTCRACQASGTLMGGASLGSPSPVSVSLKAPALTQASSTLSKRPPRMPPRAGLSDSNHSCLQSPPSTSHSSASNTPPFKPLYHFSMIHWIKYKLPKSQWLSNCGPQNTWNRFTVGLLSTQHPGPHLHPHLRQQALGS